MRTFTSKKYISNSMEKTKRIHLRASELDEKNLIAASEKLGTNKISSTICKSLETVAEMEPELIAIDQEAIKQLDALTEYSRANLQSFLDEFFKVTGMQLSIAELESCYQYTGKLGSKSLTEEVINQTVRHKLYLQLVAEYPKMTINEDNIPQKDLTGLLSIAEKMNFAPTIRIGHPVTIFWGTFRITDNKITVISSQVEAIKKNYYFFAETPEEIQKLQKIKRICAALNSILEEDKNFIPEAINRLYYYDKQAGRFMPSGNWIKFLTAQPLVFKH